MIVDTAKRYSVQIAAMQQMLADRDARVAELEASIEKIRGALK